VLVLYGLTTCEADIDDWSADDAATMVPALSGKNIADPLHNHHHNERSEFSAIL
jgi:hypothetical protein